jgi:hypothetical protein
VLELIGEMNAIADGGAQPVNSDPVVRRLALPLPPGAGVQDWAIHEWPPRKMATK